MKKVFCLYIFLISFTFFGQTSSPWRSYFSYNDIVDVSQSPSRVFGAASSAMFEKNLGTNDLKTITSVDGLKAETITAVHYSTEYNRTLVGNQNGLLIVINGDGTVINRIGIVQESTVIAAKKKINNIYEYEGKAYIATDFGIVVFNIATLEFVDTYYLGPNGAEIPILQCAIHEGIIYAATPFNGLYVAPMGSQFLNDYNQWYTVDNGQFTGVVSYNGSLYASYSSGAVSRFVNGSAVPFTVLPSQVVDMRVANGYMIITCTNRVVVYNEQLTTVSQINVIPLPEAQGAVFSCATVAAETIFVGTRDHGMFSAGFNNLNFENITPNGPQRSKIFRVKKAPSALWAVYGDYDYYYNPYPLENYGVSKYNNENGWTTITNDKLFNAASISDIAVSPTNENLVYVSSYINGLIKIQDDQPVILYNNQNTNGNLEPLPGTSSDVRINSLAFDKAGDLWMTNARVEKSVKQLRASGNGASFSSYTVKGTILNPANNDYAKMVIDKNGTKWIPTSYSGVLAFNETLDKKIIITEGANGNLPSFSSTCVAIDNNNRLWIGTNKGLRVLPGVDRFTTETSLTTNPIIILEDGLAQELMYEQGITDIVVDGSNNKWIATGGAGAFLVSPDGQQTLFHFTKENSPLPSDIINDIEIDNVTGEVYFVTERGMVSYRGTSTEAAEDLSKVYVFPNPVRPDFDGNVNISALLDKANVKITDIEGNLVYEATSEGGTVLWDTRAFGKYKVASGVYMIFISSEDGTQTKVKKVMIIR
ncbi:T9SS type A sorting domain-containing protein [Flavobacterium sp. DG1-102-2]|uniref:type IX secretion system anionic LPS delivery protein PorZ n=1 Tax=Flavobacterium sp. DG1-102-2 TaxID=3081663 RepID=UPI00294A8A23|nr:T9SS type A sorting domain-containing protein [Flavobacterium sp. DG1-102-2]MDV6169533.1 T9SS type A sorting domain-containing protein [Flavobacterium sp. DG1-102-2]